MICIVYVKYSTVCGSKDLLLFHVKLLLLQFPFVKVILLHEFALQ